MSFSDILQRKIETRRDRLSTQAAAGDEIFVQSHRDNIEQHLRLRAAPLIAAIEAMRDRLSKDQMFANAMGGRPAVLVEPWEEGAGGIFYLTGRAARFSFVVTHSGKVQLRIYPESLVSRALECRDISYMPGASVTGDLAHVDAFMVLVEDHIADFIADIALNSAAHLLLT